MTIFRIVHGAQGRRTRFHTYRGEFIGLAGLADIPQCVWRRLRPAAEPQPWLNKRAVHLLERAVGPGSRVAEFGGGHSTLWLASRCAFVLCFEDDSSWISYLRGRLGRLGSPGEVEFRMTSDFPSSAGALDPRSFDVIIVDHNEPSAGDRVRTVRMAKHAVRAGGVLILDDSDRAEYREADEAMTGWVRERLWGLRPRPLQAAETTFYRRPR